MFIMCSIHTALITAVGLVGVFFNIRMLSSCYRSKTKYTFLQTIWPLVICLVVYQVSILSMNTVAAWKGLHVQHGECCSALYVLVSTFLTFFAGGNLMVILAIESRNAMACHTQELFPTCKFFATAVLSLAFAVSVIIRCSCCRPDFALHLIAISTIVVVTIVVLLLVACGSCLQPKPPLPKTSLPNRCKKNNGTTLFITLFLLCIVVAVTQILSPHAFQPILYLLIMNATAGIALPLAFNDLIYLRSEVENEMKIVVII